MKLALLIVCLVGSVQTFACGGADLSDDEIKQSSDMQTVIAAIETQYNIAIDFQDVIRSGSKILSLDKTEVASAMCNANYINVYFSSEVENELRCMVRFTISAHTKQMNEKHDIAAVCSKNKGKQELVKINFN